MDKYLKYKKRYLKLRDQIGGVKFGDTVRLKNIEGTVKYIDGDFVIVENAIGAIACGSISECSVITEHKTEDPKIHGFSIGDNVRELDSYQTGVISEIHHLYGITHIVMTDSNGKIYDHNYYHYRLTDGEDSDEVANEIARRENFEKENRKLSRARARARGEVFVGDMVKEEDTQKKGIIESIHTLYSFPHAIMCTDNNEKYDYNYSHYHVIKPNDDDLN